MDEFIKEIHSFTTRNEENNSTVLNVSYGIDKNFLYGAGVSIASVLLHNKDINFVFHVFTDYIDDEYLDAFKKTAQQFDSSIIVYLIDPQYFVDLPTSSAWSYATYFRIYSFEYLSSSISTLLYLDADVICKGSLRKITDIKFEGEFAAVIPDSPLTQESCSKRLNLPEINGYYFNAGVMYVNLKKWKESDLKPYLLTLLKGESKYGALKYLDQDALNISFEMNNIYLSNDYNKIYTLKNELSDRSHRGYQKVINDDTALIHYTGITKPWHSWADYPSASFFNVARQESPWKYFPLKDARNISEMQKQYKHLFAHRKYVSGLCAMFKYKLKK
ncbi:glycosyltransferase family 8 protein [Kluyvera genomosp. 1]|uniref:glycosyltransferase family 8 protein n=1 Tax=Kluyvera genomosp. 1 TaxID=2774053 RepID=UPI00068A43EC|nr:glycosyltransferase [Kluyvera genomosp. 1]